MLQIKFIPTWLKPACFLSALLLVNGMTWFVTSANQKKDLYPVNADSVGIPIMLTVGVSILMLPILIVIGLLQNKSLLMWLESKGLVRRLVMRIVLLLLYGPVFLVTVYGIAYWSIPDHYSIAVSYLLLFVALLTGLFFDWRKLVISED